MNTSHYKVTTLALCCLLGATVTYAGSWDEDNAPAAGSVVSNPNQTWTNDHTGFYLGLEGGATWLNDQEFTQTTQSWLFPNFENVTGKATLKSSTGYNGGITLGYDYKLLRLEAEFNAANNPADKATIDIPGTPSFDQSISGHTTSYTGLLNAILNIRSQSGLGVFGGVGAGGSGINYNYHVHDSPDTDTWKGAFTVQALGGISYAFNRAVELDLEYRYMDAMLVPSNNHIPDYKTNNVDLGLKFFLT